MDQATPPLDLAACDREPIHIPGSIQPYGLLLTVDIETKAILQIAGDSKPFLALDAADVLGQPLDQVLEAQAIRMLGSIEPGVVEPLYLGSFTAPGAPGRKFDLTAHVSSGVFVLEFEHSSARLENPSQLLGDIRRIIVAWEAADNLTDLLGEASGQFRALTGFDRVMIYRFLENDTGVVVSEDKIDSMDALLNHHYPASDIPKQARVLYLENPIRVIADVNHVPAQLVPSLCPGTGQTLDMSHCALRSVSPVHIQYLKNMNVTASMSVSIVVDGRLWGLLSCHHKAARPVHYEMRETCKLLGQILGQTIKARLDAEKAEQAQRLTYARDELLKKMAVGGGIEQNLPDQIEDVRRLIQADGFVLFARGKLTRSGRTPTDGQTRELIEWLVGSSMPSTFATHCLAEHLESARTYAPKASGVVAVVVSNSPPSALLWFRAEYIETINWAGNPHKPIEAGTEPGRLTPRTSFEDWKETVRYQSLPWTEAEVDSARKFGRAVRDMRMQNTLHGLNAQLQRTLADKVDLLAKTEELRQEALERIDILHKREAELGTILENTSDAYIRMDETGIVTAWNRKAEEVFLWSRSEAIGNPLERLIIPPAVAGSYRQGIQRYLVDGASEVMDNVTESVLKRKDGLQIPVEVRVTAIRIENRTIFSAFLQDITQRKSLERQRLQDAQEDALTGLANRRAMYSFLKARLEQKPTLEEPIRLLYLDLDSFKPINDTLGHAAGDRVLVKVAKRLSECMRDGDLVARIGGDEFVIVASGLENRTIIEKLCKRLVTRLGEPVAIDKHEVRVGCSIGIVSAPTDSCNADDLLRFADIALYEAKAAGRNTWQFYSARMSSRLLIRRQLQVDLRLALRRNELRLEFQPRYELQSGRLIGAEALVRWQHPSQGYLLPDAFISIAEEAGLIVPLSDWVLREACLEATKWENDVFVSVNLSPLEFNSDDLVAHVKDCLDETGLAPERLELEITESVMLEHTNTALSIMKALKSLGVRLSMDDFGTGYSSLSYIHTYPFDGIKIDRSFIAAADGEGSGEAMIEAIIGLGKALSLTVTAEGVETQEQLDLLERLQCNQVQGFLLGRPASADSLRTTIGLRSQRLSAQN